MAISVGLTVTTCKKKIYVSYFNREEGWAMTNAHK